MQRRDVECEGIKKSGVKCNNKAKANGLCGVHGKVAKVPKVDSRTITITFGNAAENHKGMEILEVEGKSVRPHSYKNLHDIHDSFTSDGYTSQIVDLTRGNTRACVLIIRDYVYSSLGDVSKDLWLELSELEWDKRCRMYGRVVNKTARWNLIFGDKEQQPDYENGKGTVVAWDDVPMLRKVKDCVERDFEGSVIGEGNYYSNSDCGIGYHGDAERNCVIGLRLGDTMPLCFQWYLNFEPVGDRVDIILNDGDLYVMSEKAVGTDWKKSSILTLRHAAGADKYIK